MSSHIILVCAFALSNLGIFLYFLRHLFSGFSKIKQDLLYALDFFSDFERNQSTYEAEKNKVGVFFKTLPSLTHSWDEFSETLVREKDDQGTRFYHTEDANDFFHAETLVSGDRRSKYKFGVFNSIPQIITSIGIIGTFFSVIVALPEANTASDTNTVINLISSLKYAFISSLAGVLLAAIYQFMERAKADDLDGLCIQLADRINFTFVRKTQHEYLAGLVLKQDDIAAAIKSSISELGSQVISDFRNIATSDPSIQEGIKSAVQQGFTNLVGSLEKLVSLQKTIIENAEKINILQNSQTAILQEISFRNENMSKNTETASTAMAEISTKLSSLSEALSSTTSTSIEALKPISESVCKFIEAQDLSMRSQERFLVKIADELDKLKNSYTGFGSQISEYSTTNIEMLKKNLEDFDGSIGSAIGNINTSVSGFNGVVELLGKTVSGIDDRIVLLEKVVKSAADRESA